MTAPALEPQEPQLPAPAEVQQPRPGFGADPSTRADGTERPSGGPNLGGPDLGGPDLGEPDLGEPDLGGSAALALGWAVELAIRVLDAPIGLVTQRIDRDRVRVLCVRGPLTASAGDVYAVSAEQGQLSSADEPLRVEDWNAEHPWTVLSARPDDDVASTLAVPVLLGGQVWGRLIVHDLRPRRWADTEVEVARSLGRAVSATVERDTGEAAQAVVARFGQFALQSRDLRATADRAVDAARRALQVPIAMLAQVVGPGRVRVSSVQGPIDLAAGQEYGIDPELERQWSTAVPLQVADWRTEDQFLITAPVRLSGAISTMSATVMVGGDPWSRLIVHDTRQRDWRKGEVDVFQSLANVLAAAVEREADETAQAAVARFGQFALQSRDLRATASRAVQTAMQVMRTPIGIMVQVAGPGRVRVIWAQGPLGLGPGDEYEVDRSLEQQWRLCEPMRIRDWRCEPRYVQPAPARLAGVLSGVGVSVVVGGRVWGRLVMQDLRSREWRQDDVDVAQSLANVLSAAVEREADEAAQGVMADFGQFALQSRDLSATVERAMEAAMEALQTPIATLARMVAPGRVRMVRVRGPLGNRAGDRYELSPELARHWAVPQPLRVEDWHAERRFPQPSVGRAAGVLSTLEVPVMVDGQPWGRLVVHDLQPRCWREVELDFAQTLAHELAAAVERDLIESRLRATTRQLQRVLLPAELPDLPGIESAARYVPAGGLDVGGDWYDVLPLPHGGVGMVMGDVEGHDSTAAAIVGQVRTVLRTYVAEGYPPTEILSRVNAFVTASTDRLVTCCYVELNPWQRTITCVSAGHPAPLLLTPDGTLREIPLQPGLLLGLRGDPRHREQTSLLPAGSCLMLITDGLLDCLSGVMYPDLDTLEATARGALNQPIEALADHLVRRPGDADPLRDDAALLLVRLVDPATDPAMPRQVQRSFGPHLAACIAARSFTDDLLTAWNLAGCRQDALLAVSELVTNALIHSTGPLRLTLRASCPGQLWIGVHDGNDRQPLLAGTGAAADTTISGRGLLIVEQLASRWGVAPDLEHGGKTVWLELAVPDVPEDAAG